MIEVILKTVFIARFAIKLINHGNQIYKTLITIGIYTYFLRLPKIN